MREWTDKEGVTRSSLEVRVNDLTLLGRRDDSHQPRQQARPEPQSTGGGVADLNDDIPFGPVGGRKAHYL